MNLWDELVGPELRALETLSHPRSADLATSAIERTVGLFSPSFAEFFPPRMADLITSTIRDCRASAPQWRLDGDYLARFTASLDAVQGLPMRPGCGPLSMAVLSLVEGLVEDCGPEIVREVLYSCYEAVLMSQLTGRADLERERQNEQCRRAVAMQQELLTRFRD